MASYASGGEENSPREEGLPEGREERMIEDESRSPRVPRTPPPQDPSLAAALIAETPKVKTLRSRIAELKMEQTAAIAQNKEIAKNLRNHQRRNKRLREKVVGLTDEDMVDVLRMKQEKMAKDAAPDSRPEPGAGSSPGSHQTK